MEKRETLDTIWEAPDELWEMIELLIFEMDPPKATGRNRADPRQMLNGIIYGSVAKCRRHKARDKIAEELVGFRLRDRTVRR